MHEPLTSQDEIDILQRQQARLTRACELGADLLAAFEAGFPNPRSAITQTFALAVLDCLTGPLEERIRMLREGRRHDSGPSAEFQTMVDNWLGGKKP